MRKYTLEGEMIKKQITREDIAKCLGISMVSVQKKITGARQFKCDEMFKIKKLLNTDLTLDELFA